MISYFMHLYLPFQTSRKAIPSLGSYRRCLDKSNNNGLLPKHNHLNEIEEISDTYSDEAKKSSSPSAIFTDEAVSDRPVVVLGMNLSFLNRRSRFIICAGFVYSFSLLYGFLQELLSVHLLNRKLGLFLAMWQMMICTILSCIFRRFHVTKQQMYSSHSSNLHGSCNDKPSSLTPCNMGSSLDNSTDNAGISWQIYFGLSILRAIEIGMANLSMQYMNYPAKTLMKSSRVIFTILFGLLVLRRKYPVHDYIIAALTVTGLALFLHADSTSSAVFRSMGIVMLVRFFYYINREIVCLPLSSSLFLIHFILTLHSLHHLCATAQL
jgi:hypothetical protein